MVLYLFLIFQFGEDRAVIGAGFNLYDAWDSQIDAVVGFTVTTSTYAENILPFPSEPIFVNFNEKQGNKIIKYEQYLMK